VSAERRDYCYYNTIDQGDDHSGEWILQRRGHVTASYFGDIVKHRAAKAPLVIRIVHKVTRETAAIWYGNVNEPCAQLLYGGAPKNWLSHKSICGEDWLSHRY